MEIKPRLIIGLGNPGSRYVLTYHNVGWLALDCFIESMTAAMTLTQKGKKKNFEFFKFVNERSLIFLKPLTFMNESGKAVAASLRYFKIKPEEILVIHDDSDIELGKFKFSFGRGAAGHKGVQSIIDELKTSAKDGSLPAGRRGASGGKKFSRLRIGIRKIAEQTRNPEGKQTSYGAGLTRNRREKAGEMVLKRITLSDKLTLTKLFTELKI